MTTEVVRPQVAIPRVRVRQLEEALANVKREQADAVRHYRLMCMAIERAQEVLAEFKAQKEEEYR